MVWEAASVRADPLRSTVPRRPSSTPTRPTPLASAPARTGTCVAEDEAVASSARLASPVPRHPATIQGGGKGGERRGGVEGGRATRQRNTPTRRPAHRHPWKRRQAPGARGREDPALVAQGGGGGVGGCGPTRHQHAVGTKPWPCPAALRLWRWPPHASPATLLFLLCVFAGPAVGGRRYWSLPPAAGLSAHGSGLVITDHTAPDRGESGAGGGDGRLGL